MATTRWYQIAVFHLVPEPLVQMLTGHVEALRDPAAAAVEIQHAVFSLPRTWSPLEPHTVTVHLDGLSLELPAIDVRPVLERLPHLPPLPSTADPVFTLAGDVRILYVDETQRRALSAGLRDLWPSIRDAALADLQTVDRSLAYLRAWERPCRSALHS